MPIRIRKSGFAKICSLLHLQSTRLLDGLHIQLKGAFQKKPSGNSNLKMDSPVDLENHRCLFKGGILQCAHHSIDQMLTHESDIMASMIGEAKSLDEIKEPSIRRYLDICGNIIKERPHVLTTFVPDLKDMYEKDPSEILLTLFDNKAWNSVLENFTLQFQFENVRQLDSATELRIPIKEQIISVPLNTEIPLPGIQQYFLKSVNNTDPAGYMKRIDSVSNYLLLNLMVYDHQNGRSVKTYPKHLNIHTLVSLSFNTISMGKVSYRLRGMIMHQGSGTGSGHYYYVLLDDKFRQWAFDDQGEHVMQKNLESFTAKECPYMLLYRRI
jgi:hypothetical protein